MIFNRIFLLKKTDIILRNGSTLKITGDIGALYGRIIGDDDTKIILENGSHADFKDKIDLSEFFGTKLIKAKAVLDV